MLGRRSFLKHSGFLALSAIVPGQAGAAVMESLRPTSVQAFVAEEGGAALAFSRALPFLSCDRTDIARGLNFHGAMLGVARGGADFLVGLTRDSEFFLMSQIAEENGYELVYHGTHHDRQGAIFHTLAGSRTLVDRLARELPDDERHWAAVIADNLPEMATSSEFTGKQEVYRRHSRLEETPAYLVSWAFRQPALRFPS